MAGAYKNITSSATTVIKSGVTVLHRVVVNNPGSTWVVAIYDNTAGSGATVATLSPETAGGGDFEYETSLSNGLTVVTSGTTAGDITVVYS